MSHDTRSPFLLPVRTAVQALTAGLLGSAFAVASRDAAFFDPEFGFVLSTAAACFPLLLMTAPHVGLHRIPATALVLLVAGVPASVVAGMLGIVDPVSGTDAAFTWPSLLLLCTVAAFPLRMVFDRLDRRARGDR